MSGHLRKVLRRRSVLEQHAAAERPGPRDPEEELARKELASALVRAMDGLSAVHREAFVLCELEELSSGEVGHGAG